MEMKMKLPMSEFFFVSRASTAGDPTEEFLYKPAVDMTRHKDRLLVVIFSIQASSWILLESAIFPSLFLLLCFLSWRCNSVD